MIGASQPAQECGRLIRKKLNSSNYVMYLCPLYIRCHVPILFTCIAVLIRLIVKGGYTCEIRVEGTKSKLPGEPK